MYIYFFLYLTDRFIVMKAFVLLFIVLILSFSSENKQQNDLERANLKGKVKTLRQISYHTIDKFGEITKGAIDGPGILAPDEYYNKYNVKGFIIERVERYFGDGDSLILEQIYKYDDKGNEIEINQSAPNGERGKETFKYDDKGNPIELNTYYPIDSLEMSYRYTYKYDDKDNIIEETIYTNGSLEGRLVTYKYDDKDNLTEVSVYTIDGILHWENIFKYDDKGNEIEKNSFKNGSLSWKEISKYDDNGNKIESSNFNQNDVNHKFIYKYDDKDNLIEKTYLSDGGYSSKEIYKYDYDEKNNWIKRIDFGGNTPKYIIERIIEYY
mgnify:CR=1 FL=1